MRLKILLNLIGVKLKQMIIIKKCVTFFILRTPEELAQTPPHRGTDMPYNSLIHTRTIMTEIDLSKYVGKEVICTLSDGKTLSGFVSIFDHCGNYPYMVDGWTFTITGKGFSRTQIKSIQLKNPMTEIDLSKYVGKEVICTLEGGEIHSGLVRELDPAYKFPYGVGRCDFDISGKGYSKSQIESIQLKNPMIGIAQKHPNINLEDFEGQRCYVKWSDGRGSIGTILRKLSSSGISFWNVVEGSALYGKNGTALQSSAYIKEIYGEGAYEITTKDTFDTPSTDAVEKATEALKDLTEEQIAKVLHALKSKSN
jgi:small nuclear ribonucleoprotein (snRNP)-like protein